MKISLIILLAFFITACGGNQEQSESAEADGEVMIADEANTTDVYYDYSQIEEVLEIEVNRISCEYIANSIVSCDFDITNPNDRYLYDLFLTFYPINENGESGELGISQMSGGHYKIAPEESKEFSALLTTFPSDTKYLRFTIDTNEKAYKTDISDYDVVQIKSL